MTPTLRFHKSERLSHRSAIDDLFATGKTFNQSPLKVWFRMHGDCPQACRVLIAVPRRRFKRAVDRNRLRRMIREAYRLNRSIIMDEAARTGRCTDIGIVFTGDSAAMEYSEIEAAMQAVLRKLKNICAYAEKKS